MFRKIPVFDILVPELQKIEKKTLKKIAFSSFKPNCSKTAAKDFGLSFINCSPVEFVSTHLNLISRRILILEIFEPDSAENFKKSRKKNTFFSFFTAKYPKLATRISTI